MSNLTLKENPTLADLQVYVAEMVRLRGFNDNIPHRFMLLLEECGEFARAARKHVGGKFAADTQTADLDEEAADVLIILLGLCNMLDVDLEKAFRAKEEKNNSRSWK
jgi:NTP pyrophosphatase (non-canonical NTP hydrolase)